MAIPLFRKQVQSEHGSVFAAQHGFDANVMCRVSKYFRKVSRSGFLT